MGGFLSELGKRLAERWLSLLVLPGALYLAVAFAAHTLGHSHFYSLSSLTQQITARANQPSASTVGGQVVLLAAILAGAAAVGLAAQALGSLAERLWLAADWPAWRRPFRQRAAGRTGLRQENWTTAARAWHKQREEDAQALAQGQRADPAARHAAERVMIRIALEEPERPTWSGDRLNAVAVRLQRDYDLDLAILWPHLWLVLPEEIRTQVTAARQNLTRAISLAAWALLYLFLASCWWPAAFIALTLVCTSWSRTRATVDDYALLLEATTRIHARELADIIGLDATGPLTREIGEALMRHLTPSSPPRPDTAR